MIRFHNPDEVNGYLSNWYLSRFVVDGQEFSSVEQYMMYRKALVFGDEESAKAILGTDDVARIKALGREVRGYDEVVWSGVRQVAVFRGLLAKFRQNRELEEKLLGTGDEILVECAVKDKVWGVGLSMKDPTADQIKNWNGQNLLGFALMEVRTALQNK